MALDFNSPVMRIAIVLLILCPVFASYGQVTDSLPSDAPVSQPVPGEQDPQVKEKSLPPGDEAHIRIAREEVPMFLQRVLQDEKYRGWEGGGVFRNDQNTLFKVEVRDGMNNRNYYFDHEGTLVRAE